MDAKYAKYARTIGKRMLSMRLRMVRAYLACAYQTHAYAKYARTKHMRMLSMRL